MLGVWLWSDTRVTVTMNEAATTSSSSVFVHEIKNSAFCALHELVVAILLIEHLPHLARVQVPEKYDQAFDARVRK
jgi:uncharacterized membrane protein